jgi:hypothetical protein
MKPTDCTEIHPRSSTPPGPIASASRTRSDGKNGVESSSNYRVLLIPYLHGPARYRTDPLRIGPWIFEFAEDIEDSLWEVPELKAAAVNLASKYDSEGVLVGRQERCPVGKPIDPREGEALALAIWFSLLATQLNWQQTKWQASENATVFECGIDPTCSRFTRASGALIRSTEGGLPLNDPAAIVPRPLDIPRPGHHGSCSLDQILASDCFSYLNNPGSGGTRSAIGWLRKTWQNSASVSSEDRIVFLHVVAEVLSGEERGKDQREQLSSEYSRAAKILGTAALLTEDSAAESCDFKLFGTRKGSEGRVTGTPISRFFAGLADLRNKILHEGQLPQNYEEINQQMLRLPIDDEDDGDLLSVGTRLLVDIIRLRMIDAGFTD